MNLIEKLTTKTVEIYHANAMYTVTVDVLKKASVIVNLFSHMENPGFAIWDDVLVDIDGLLPMQITRIITRPKHDGNEYTLKLELP